MCLGTFVHMSTNAMPLLDLIRWMFIDLTHNHDDGTALRQLCDDPAKKYAISQTTASTTIPTVADLLVGFLAHSDVVFDLTLDNKENVICSCNIAAGNFVFAVENKYQLPLRYAASASFHIVMRKGDISDIAFVFAHLRCDFRRMLVFNMFKMKLDNDKYMTFANGLCVICTKTIIEDLAISFPFCSYKNVYNSSNIKRAISTCGMDAIDVIYTVFHDTHKDVNRTRQALEGITAFNSLNLSSDIIDPLKNILASKDLLKSILRYIDINPIALHHMMESVKMIKLDANPLSIDSVMTLVNNPSMRFATFVNSAKDAVRDIGIPRHGDIVVGFIARNNVSFAIKANGRTVCSHTLEPGQYVYAINNKYPILLLCASWTSVHIDMVCGSVEDIDIVYGLLQNCDRITMVSHRFIMDLQNGTYLEYNSGHISVLKEPPLPHHMFIEFPAINV